MIDHEGVTGNFAVRVGERLRAVRKQKRMSLQSIEAESNQEFKASVLGAYERGERSISVPRLQRLAAFYNVPVDQLLPRDPAPDDSAASAPAGHGEDDEAAKVTIDLSRLAAVSGPERDLLRRYLGMIQVQRHDFNGRVLTIRDNDVRAIACLLDLSADGMRSRLDDLGLRLSV